MDGLIELVAASLARHGIECPAGDSPLTRSALTKPALKTAVPILATTLPDHNFTKGLQEDPAP